MVQLQKNRKRWLSRVIFGLRLRVRVVQKKSHNFLESYLAYIHGAVNAIAWLRPIHFSGRHFRGQTFSAIAELDGQQIPAQDDGYAVKGIAVPGRCFSRCQPLTPHQVISAMMKHFLRSGWLVGFPGHQTPREEEGSIVNAHSVMSSGK